MLCFRVPRKPLSIQEGVFARIKSFVQKLIRNLVKTVFLSIKACFLKQLAAKVVNSQLSQETASPLH